MMTTTRVGPMAGKPGPAPPPRPVLVKRNPSVRSLGPEPYLQCVLATPPPWCRVFGLGVGLWPHLTVSVWVLWGRDMLAAVGSRDVQVKTMWKMIITSYFPGQSKQVGKSLQLLWVMEGSYLNFGSVSNSN